MTFLRRWFAISFLLLIFFACSWQLLITPGMYRVHDATHVSRIAEMTRALQDGHFPVRWTENFGWGYGMPLFEFYAPLPFYVGSFFYWLGLSAMTSLKLLYLIANLLSLLGMYLLGRKLFGTLGGLIAATSFTLAPYRAVNLFVRGALSEAWGLQAMPWILLALLLCVDAWQAKTSKSATKKIEQQSHHAWLMLVLSLTALVISHNLSALMFVPMSLLFVLVYAWKRGMFAQELSKIFRFFVFLGSALVLALGLVSFYVFPTFLEKSFTIVEHQTLTGYFHYTNHFLYIRQFFMENWGYGGSAGGLMDEISFFLGFAELLAAFFLLLLLAKQVVTLVQQFIQGSEKLGSFTSFIHKHLLLISWGLILGVSLFLAIYKSRFIWDAVSIIDFIQFPWRWLTVAIVFLALINGYLLTQVKNSFRRFALFLLLFVAFLYNARYFQFKTVQADPWEYHCESPECVTNRMSDVLPDYYPVGMIEHVDLPQPSDLLNEQNVETLVDRVQEKLYSVSYTDERELSLPVAGYPGWRAELDGQPVEWHNSDLGSIAVIVPAGDHKVGLYFGATPVRRWSDVASFVSLLIFLYIAIDFKKAKQLV